MLNNKKLDTFIFYSSELIHYKTIVKAKNEDDAYKKYDVNKKDEVYRNEYQIDSVETHHK